MSDDEVEGQIDAQLDDVVANIQGQVDDRLIDYPQKEGIAREEPYNSGKANDELRAWVAKEILPLFKTINIYVICIVILAMLIDSVIIGLGYVTAEQRLINSEVIMALIGAATVQLGSIMFTISAYLFPKA